MDFPNESVDPVQSGPNTANEKQVSFQSRCGGITQVRVQTFHFSAELARLPSHFISSGEQNRAACVICF